MDYLTSHLYFPCIYTPLWVYVYTKKVDMTSKIFHDVLQESFRTKLSSKEKNEKNKYTLKKSNKIIVQIKWPKNTVWKEGDSGKLATLSSDIQWNIKQFSVVRCYDGTKPQSGLYSALGIKY